MDMNDILSGDNSTDSSSLLPDVSSSINDMLAPFIWFSVILTIVFVGLYIYSMVRRRRLENALFDIQKNIAELNERDKSRTSLSSPSPSPSMKQRIEPVDDTIIAKTDEPSSDA